MVGYDFLGNIAILKFEKENSKEKKKIAEKILKEKKNVTSVFEKYDKIKGRLRTLKLKHLAGEKSKEALYIENSCKFKLDVEKCYFSSRLSNERKEVAEKIKKSDSVLVMFAGVGPFPIVISKLSKCKKIIGIELGRECCKYFKENVKLNKLNNIEVIQGDVKKKVNSSLGKFDVIVMPRPQLKEDFLKQAFLVSKKGTRIFYYDFGRELYGGIVNELGKKIIEKAKENKKKIKIQRIKKAGEIAPYKFRWRFDLKAV